MGLSFLGLSIMEPTLTVRGTVIAMWFSSTGHHPPMNFMIESNSGQLPLADNQNIQSYVLPLRSMPWSYSINSILYLGE